MHGGEAQFLYFIFVKHLVLHAPQMLVEKLEVLLVDGFFHFFDFESVY